MTPFLSEMKTEPPPVTDPFAPISIGKISRTPVYWDLIAVVLVLGLLIFFAETSRGLMLPLEELRKNPISLDLANLPGFAARTTL